MYVVTFYSFKGGTGRTMALANVAVELASQGRRVLMVDFDLEAPGLDTFRIAGAASEQEGIVDFIHAYLNTGEIPDVREYVHKTGVDFDGECRLWLMPAGRPNDEYDTRFKSIDWQRLYLEQDGYMLFEDLKAQWEAALSPDYVLIDSRTGHTDIGGICTRQLPDAVVVMFFPNEQNRRGLQPIVEDIRSEAEGTRGKEIQLHFVMANVPDLDDEEEILAENVSRMRESLEYGELAAVIHHYNSLSLLNQSIFTAERPRSRLTQEYKRLTRSIVIHNLEDREGAIAFLDELMTQLRNRTSVLSAVEVEDKLQVISVKHRNDGEVLRRLARLRRRQRQWEEALALLDAAEAAGMLDSELVLSRTEIAAFTGKQAEAVQQLKRLLDISEVSAFDLIIAIRMAIDLQAKEFLTALPAAAVSRFDTEDLLLFSRELQSSADSLPIAEAMLRRLLSGNVTEERIQDVWTELTLCVIGQGRFEEAKDLICPTSRSTDQLRIDEAFNYAMAEWGSTRTIREDLFSKVFEPHAGSDSSRNANYYQCLAIAAWAVGKRGLALRYNRDAFNQMMAKPELTYSAWSYLSVRAQKFFQELQSIESLIEGADVVPEFMLRAKSQPEFVF